MSLRKICEYPDPVLRETTLEVTEFDDQLKELIKDVDESTEISVWSEIPLQKLNIEIIKYDFGEIDVDINVE